MDPIATKAPYELAPGDLTNNPVSDCWCKRDPDIWRVLAVNVYQAYSDVTWMHMPCYRIAGSRPVGNETVLTVWPVAALRLEWAEQAARHLLAAAQLVYQHRGHLEADMMQPHLDVAVNSIIGSMGTIGHTHEVARMIVEDGADFDQAVEWGENLAMAHYDREAAQ